GLELRRLGYGRRRSTRLLSEGHARCRHAYGYARVFDTVEVDSTFYAVPSAQTLDAWTKRTPRSFTFSLKLPQVITHEWALRAGSLEELSLYCDRAQLLGEKLAVTLIQLPPHFILTPEN